MRERSIVRRIDAFWWREGGRKAKTALLSSSQLDIARQHCQRI